MSYMFEITQYRIRDGQVVIWATLEESDEGVSFELLEEIKECHVALTAQKLSSKEWKLSAELLSGEVARGTYKLVSRKADGNTQVAVPAAGVMSEAGMDNLHELWFEPETNNHFFFTKKQDIWSVRKWYTSSEGIHKKPVFWSEWNTDGYEITGTIDYPYKKKIRQAEIWIWSRALRKVVRIPLNAEQVQSGTIAFSMKDFMNQYYDTDGRLWELSFVMNLEGGYHICRIEQAVNRKRLNRRQRAMDEGSYWPVEQYHKSLDESERNLQAKPLEQARVFHTFFSREGQLCAKVIPREMLYLPYLHERVTNLSIQKGICRIEIEVVHPEFEFQTMMFRNLHDEELEYEMTLTREWDQDGKKHLMWEQDITQIEWRQYSWGFFLYAEKSGIRYLIRPINPDIEFRKAIFHRRRNFYRQEKICVFPYITQNDYPVLFCREYNRYDSAWFWLKEQIACIWYHYRKKYYEERRIVLSYEKFGAMAQDNSYYMFQYLMENSEVPDEIRKDCYYIIDKKQKDYKKLRKYRKQVLGFGSIKHLIYLQGASVYLAIDSKRHAYPWRAGNSRILDRMEQIPFYFLQHGVLGMKRVEYIYGRGTVNEATCMVASSEREKRIIERYFEYEPYQIVTAGLARWDVLKDRSKLEGSREILLMPTWRNWLQEVDEETFLDSDYYKNYNALLQDSKLLELLKQQDLKLIFCMHPKFREFMHRYQAGSDSIELYSYDTMPINELLMRCSMMITDYSSASWDVFRMGKPIIFYQFDYTRYIEEQGSYFDMEKELFGDRVMTTEDLVGAIETTVANGFQEKAEYATLRESYFYNEKESVRSKIYAVLRDRFLTK